MRQVEQEKQLGLGGYQRGQEKDQDIGDEFLNPDKQMEEATIKIQKMYRGHLGRKEYTQKKKKSSKKPSAKKR